MQLRVSPSAVHLRECNTFTLASLFWSGGCTKVSTRTMFSQVNGDKCWVSVDIVDTKLNFGSYLYKQSLEILGRNKIWLTLILLRGGHGCDRMSHRIVTIIFWQMFGNTNIHVISYPLNKYQSKCLYHKIFWEIWKYMCGKSAHF